ncbi:MAG: undecaprenyl diphosphate synthase family protein [Thermoflexus sp.]
MTPVYWPDFDRQELLKAIEAYSWRERRFGQISEQLAPHQSSR